MDSLPSAIQKEKEPGWVKNILPIVGLWLVINLVTWPILWMVNK